MSDRITQQEYEAEVRSIAETCREEAREREGDPDEALEETLWETVDSHEWIIYTHKAQQVVSLSQNENYAAESFGVESIVTEDGFIRWESIAFGALYADVQEELAR